jgi:hypothetical protein
MTGPEILRSAQVIRNQAGQAEAVQLSIDAWGSLLEWIEDLEDRAIVKQALPRLEAGPGQSRALDWAQVGGEWQEKPSSE